MTTFVTGELDRRPNLNFYEMGFKPGYILHWVDDERITAVVKSEKKVYYKGQSYSLTALTTLLKGYSTNPCPCWKYNGQNLSDIYDLTYGVRRIPDRLWSRDELIVALSLYHQLTFGRLNHATPEVQALATLMGRSKNSLAIRLTNFAACDPYIINSGRRGMTAGIKVCQPIWDEFANDCERLFLEAERIKAEFRNNTIEHSLGITETDLIGTTKEVVVKQRINQNVFRAMILNNYNETCAITGINDSRLLIASHIIPWAEREDTRLNPENGICLSALYDKAFDKGLITIRPDDYTVMVSTSLKDRLTKDVYSEHFGKIEDKKIILPEEHKPNSAFLEYHAEKVYVG